MDTAQRCDRLCYRDAAAKPASAARHSFTVVPQTNQPQTLARNTTQGHLQGAVGVYSMLDTLEHAALLPPLIPAHSPCNAQSVAFGMGGGLLQLNTLQSDALTTAPLFGISTVSQSVAFGMGGGLLQRVNRDTLSLATKLCHIVYADGSGEACAGAWKTGSSASVGGLPVWKGTLCCAVHTMTGVLIFPAAVDTMKAPQCLRARLAILLALPQTTVPLPSCLQLSIR